MPCLPCLKLHARPARTCNTMLQACKASTTSCPRDNRLTLELTASGSWVHVEYPLINPILASSSSELCNRRTTTAFNSNSEIVAYLSLHLWELVTNLARILLLRLFRQIHDITTRRHAILANQQLSHLYTSSFRSLEPNSSIISAITKSSTEGSTKLRNSLPKPQHG
jgi:hypothetical protein